MPSGLAVLRSFAHGLPNTPAWRRVPPAPLGRGNAPVHVLRRGGRRAWSNNVIEREWARLGVPGPMCEVARSTGFEPVTLGYSIQLSYGFAAGTL